MLEMESVHGSRVVANSSKSLLRHLFIRMCFSSRRSILSLISSSDPVGHGSHLLDPLSAYVFSEQIKHSLLPAERIFFSKNPYLNSKRLQFVLLDNRHSF